MQLLTNSRLLTGKGWQNKTAHGSSRADALIQCLPTAAPKDPPRLLLIGDSHAAHLRPVLANFGSQLIQLTDRNLSQPLARPKRVANRLCAIHQNNSMQLSKAGLGPGALVILGPFTPSADRP